MFQYASNLRDTGKEMVRRAVNDQTEGITGLPGAKSDAALGAGTALATIDIFFGGGGWQENFNRAKEMVKLYVDLDSCLVIGRPSAAADGQTRRSGSYAQGVETYSVG